MLIYQHLDLQKVTKYSDWNANTLKSMCTSVKFTITIIKVIKVYV